MAYAEEASNGHAGLSSVDEIDEAIVAAKAHLQGLLAQKSRAATAVLPAASIRQVLSPEDRIFVAADVV